MAIQTLDLTKFTNDEHYTVIELVLHTVTAAGIGNRMATQRLSALQEAYKSEGCVFKVLHKRFGMSDLNEIDRQLCDKTERSAEMQELFRLCTDKAILDAVDESRLVRAATDKAYGELVEILNALLVVSPNPELSKVETQLNHQVQYVDFRYHDGQRSQTPTERTAAVGQLRSGGLEAEVRLLTIPLAKKVQ